MIFSTTTEATSSGHKTTKASTSDKKEEKETSVRNEDGAKQTTNSIHLSKRVIPTVKENTRTETIYGSYDAHIQTLALTDQATTELTDVQSLWRDLTTSSGSLTTRTTTNHGNMRASSEISPSSLLCRHWNVAEQYNSDNHEEQVQRRTENIYQHSDFNR